MSSLTPNYGLLKPATSDSMAAFQTNFNDNWDRINGIPAPNIITGALPQVGSYNVGDRVFRTNDNSIYILVTKDATWGWFWRPVHAAIAPWITVPTAVNVAGAPWSFAFDVNNPFAISLDNRGNCYWRGAVGVTSGLITRNSSITLTVNMPTGILPRQSSMYLLGHDAYGAAAGQAEAGRIFIPEVNSAPVTVRLQGNGTNAVNVLYLDGNVQYAIGTAHYFTP